MNEDWRAALDPRVARIVSWLATSAESARMPEDGQRIAAMLITALWDRPSRPQDEVYAEVAQQLDAVVPAVRELLPRVVARLTVLQVLTYAHDRRIACII